MVSDFPISDLAATPPFRLSDGLYQAAYLSVMNIVMLQ